MLSVPLNSLAVLHERGSISYESWTNRIYKGSLGYLHLGSFSNRFFVEGFYLIFTYLCLLTFRAGSRSPAISRVKLLAKMING